MRANHDELLAEVGSGRIVWRPITQVIAELGLIDEHGKTTAIGRHAHNLAGGRSNRPVSAGETP